MSSGSSCLRLHLLGLLLLAGLLTASALGAELGASATSQPASALLIERATGNAGAQYSIVPLCIGQRLYTSGRSVISQLPASMDGMSLLQGPKHGDVGKDTHLEVTLAEPAYLYVCLWRFDPEDPYSTVDLGKEFPAGWLSEHYRITDKVVRIDPGLNKDPLDYCVYRSNQPFPAGMVTLHGFDEPHIRWIILAGKGIPLREQPTGQTLSNGIVLPVQWPPQRPGGLQRVPQEVPYLESPPAVCPIDVGRQLFVDDFLIEQTTCTRTFHRPRMHEGNPVLKAQTDWEGDRAIPFSDGVWFDPADRQFKMWYWSDDKTCLAVSRDGLAWDRPKLDVVDGTNIVIESQRDTNTVWLDLLETDPARRYKSFMSSQVSEQDGRTKYHLFYRTSPDGVHWSDTLASSPILGDRSTVFYNPFRNVWVYSVRRAVPAVGRARLYHEHADPALGLGWEERQPVPWLGADNLDTPRPDFPSQLPQLYNFDAVAYESIMLGLFSLHQGPENEVCDAHGIQKQNQILLGFSRDGFHFSRPDRRPFIGVSEDPKAWNAGNVQSVGGCCLIVGDRLYFYFSGRSNPTRGLRDGAWSTGLATLRRDGFASMDAGDQPATLTTRPVSFSGSYLFINASASGGSVRAEVLDEQGQPVKGFELADCMPFEADSTRQMLSWRSGRTLADLAGRPVRLRFELARAQLYAFWVSPDFTGTSRGYLAAGGPGLDGPVDLPPAGTDAHSSGGPDASE